MKTAMLSIAAASLVTCVIAACSAPPETLPKQDQDQTASSKNGSDDSKTPSGASTTPPPAAAATTPPPAAGTTPPPAGSTPGADPTEAQFVQCATQCIGNDPAAIQIFNTDEACFSKCQDDTCDNKCDDASPCSAQSAPASCDKIIACSDKCDPQPSGGAQGNQQQGN